MNDHPARDGLVHMNYEGPLLTATDSGHSSHVAPGMPPLDHRGKTVSRFEFWPLWLMYLPVALQWLLLSIRYRSLTLPLIANPAVPLSGMVGVPKSRILALAGPGARPWILPWQTWEVTAAPVPGQCREVLALLEEQGLSLPLVAKPDIGCRGAGVKLLRRPSELQTYLADFPCGASIQFQKLSRWEAEAGVFYVRHPARSRGRITSLTLKYSPYVVGDGHSTLAELVAREPRAGELLHLYKRRHLDAWQRVIPAGQPYRLVFSASHCRGAVFRDGHDLISAALQARLDELFADIPGFFYGRLDIKFRDVDSLKAGREFEIIEINGASAESLHIWDRHASLPAAIGTLLQQYHTLFRLGDASRRQGQRPPGLPALWRAWRYETNLVKKYPLND